MNQIHFKHPQRRRIQRQTLHLLLLLARLLCHRVVVLHLFLAYKYVDLHGVAARDSEERIRSDYVDAAPTRIVLGSRCKRMERFI